MAAAGPSSAHTEIRHYNHDAWTSVTDTIVLPDQGAILGALAPVFVPSAPGERRTVTVFYPVMSQQSADKLVGREERAARWSARARPRRSPCPTIGRSRSTGAGWTPRSGSPGSSRSASTWPRTPGSPRPRSRWASACRAAGGGDEARERPPGPWGGEPAVRLRSRRADPPPGQQALGG